MSRWIGPFGLNLMPTCECCRMQCPLIEDPRDHICRGCQHVVCPMCCEEFGHFGADEHMIPGKPKTRVAKP